MSRLLVMKGDAKLLYIYMVPETMALVLECGELDQRFLHGS